MIIYFEKKTIREISKVINSPEKLAEAKFYCETDRVGLNYWCRPVDIGEFCLSDRYMNLKDSIRPVVLEDMKALFCDEYAFAYCPYEEAVFDEAIGSGKSYKSSIIASYFLYHCLCLESPQRCFDLDVNSGIVIMNMSINGVQAKKVVFGEIKNRLLNSPWFRPYQPDPEVKSELRFAKNITIMPGHSGETYPLGFGIICGIMDEAAFYTETAEKDVAEEMYYALQRRIKNRFKGSGLLVMISSPRYTDDFIERKMAEAKNDPKIFARRRRIWEVMPEDIVAIQRGEVFELSGEKIPVRYQKDFQKNPEKAWRDLGAKPSLTLEPFIKQWALIEACIDNRPDPIGLDTRLLPWLKGNALMRYYVHVDLGLTHDACGFAMGHAEGGKIVIDLMMKIKPPVGGEIDINEIVNMVKELKQRGFVIKSITYDQFQSASSIQALNRLGFNSSKLSVESLEAYETMKEQFYQNKVRIYKFDPFLMELKRLEMIKGKKVDHPTHSSKDICDAVCGVIFGITVNEMDKRYATVVIA